MKRAVAVVTMVAFGLAACGGGDDEPAADEVPAADEGSSEDTVDDVTEDTVDDVTEDTVDDSGDGTAISSIDQIPQECQDLMADFLRDLEPIVSEIDWQTATLEDFEQISTDFEERGDEFDAASVDAGCDDLDMEDDGFGLIIEFANDVAPDTVPFFEFLDQFMGSVGAGSSDDDGSGAGAPETCDDAIAAIQRLVAEYDGISQIPLSEMSAITNLGSVMMSCTPEQMEYFDSPEVNDFLSR